MQASTLTTGTSLPLFAIIAAWARRANWPQRAPTRTWPRLRWRTSSTADVAKKPASVAFEKARFQLDPVVLLRGLGGVEGLEAAPVEVRDDDFDAF